MAWVTPSNVTTGDLITAAHWNQDIVANTIALLPVGIIFPFNGGGAVVTTGTKYELALEIPFKCDIDRVTLLADLSGTIQIDIWKDTYTNWPPTVADTILGTKPALSAAAKYQDSTLTGWTKAITAGDTIIPNVDSSPAPATVTSVVMILKASRS